MKRRRRPEIEYITPLTEHNASFIASLGHNISMVAKCDNKIDDVFLIDGEKIQRRNFYEYASKRHKLLRYHMDMSYNIKNDLSMW